MPAKPCLLKHTCMPARGTTCQLDMKTSDRKACMQGRVHAHKLAGALHRLEPQQALTLGWEPKETHATQQDTSCCILYHAHSKHTCRSAFSRLCDARASAPPAPLSLRRVASEPSLRLSWSSPALLLLPSSSEAGGCLLAAAQYWAGQPKRIPWEEPSAAATRAAGARRKYWPPM